MMILFFRFVVGFHFFIIIANILAIPTLLVTQSWYISIPLATLLINLMGSNIQCPLTKLENRIRKSLGYKQIGGFIGHYFIKYIKIYKAKQSLIKSGV